MEIKRNEWNHITSEIFDYKEALEFLKLKDQFQTLCNHFGWDYSFWDNREPSKYTGKVEFNTCVNVSKDFGHPSGPSFSCTSACEPTIDNINHCIDWILHCENIKIIEIQECEEDY